MIEWQGRPRGCEAHGYASGPLWGGIDDGATLRADRRPDSALDSVLALGVWASTFAAAGTIVTAAPLLASAIVGGIFGFSKASSN